MAKETIPVPPKGSSAEAEARAKRDPDPNVKSQSDAANESNQALAHLSEREKEALKVLEEIQAEGLAKGQRDDPSMEKVSRAITKLKSKSD